MKKTTALLTVLALILAASLSVFAASDKSGKDNSKGAGASVGAVATAGGNTERNTEKNSGQNTEPEKNTERNSEGGKESIGKSNDLQKQFKAELNEEKKSLQQEKRTLAERKTALQAEYDALIAAGDKAGAEAKLQEINGLNAQIQGLDSRIKETINERHMIVKTMYTDEELAQFESATDVIKQMYADAKVLSAGCVTVNNNIIKFDAPAYLKGGVTLVPVRAITEGLGAEVSWNAETQTVTVSKGSVVIEMTAGSTTVTVNGAPAQLEVSAAVNCGRVYIPLRFLAEALSLDVSWDGENQIIDIDNVTGSSGDTTEPVAEVPATEATTEPATEAATEPATEAAGA